MKRIVSVLSLCGMLAVSAHAANNVHFTGNLLAGSCSPVIVGTAMEEIIFPPAEAADLQASGQSARVPVTLKLANCESSLQNVKVTFSGTEDPLLAAGFLALASGSRASGVGIGIETSNGTAVPVNSTAGVTFPLTAPNTTLNFNAWLQVEPGVTIVPGEFSASMTATFEYF